MRKSRLAVDPLSSPPTLRSWRPSRLNGLGSLASAKAGQLSHLSSPTYKPLLSRCSATAIILRAEDLPECPGIGLVVERPYLAFAKALGYS